MSSDELELIKVAIGFGMALLGKVFHSKLRNRKPPPEPIIITQLTDEERAKFGQTSRESRRDGN